MHGIYFISILYAIFSLSLTCLQPIFWFSKETYFYAIENLSFWNKKQQKNSRENSLGNDQHFGKNSFKITLKQL